LLLLHHLLLLLLGQLRARMLMMAMACYDVFASCSTRECRRGSAQGGVVCQAHIDQCGKQATRDG
jgi:hypothetical protein